MIETLNGMIETVNFKKSTTLKLYDNVQNEDYPAHWHPAIEIIMPIENSYYLHFPNRDVELKKDDICFICPGCIHAIAAPSTGRRVIFQPNTTQLRFMREVEVLLSVMYPYTIVTKEDYPEIHGKIKELLLEIKKEYMSGDSFSEMNIYSKLLEMLVLVGRNHAKNYEDSMDDKMKTQDELVIKFTEICDYINSHCSEELKLDAIAGMSGFSKFHFERLFKQFTGTSFYKYVNQKRIVKAQEMLMEPNNTVTDVAVHCGFSSISSFIRMFKIHKGCTPSEFKNMYWKVDLHVAKNAAL